MTFILSSGGTLDSPEKCRALGQISNNLHKRDLIDRRGAADNSRALHSALRPHVDEERKSGSARRCLVAAASHENKNVYTYLCVCV